MKKTEKYLLIILVLALFVRLLFIFQPGFGADIAYWKWWSSASAEKGLIHTINYVNYNYPSFYLYILKLTGHIYLLFAPTNSPDFWNTYNPLFLFLIKLPYILADLGIGILIFLITKKVSSKNLASSFQLLASALYLFNPVAIYNSAIWGQTDSLGTFFILLAVFLAFKEKLSLSAIVLSLAFFLKIQTNIFILLTFVYIFLKFGLSKTIKAAAITTISSLVLNTPYLLSHTFDKVVATILESFNYFPFISLNAYNLPWFLAPSGRPDKILDTTLLFGNLNYKTMGLILFASAFIISILNLLNSRFKILASSFASNSESHTNLDIALIESSSLAAFSFYMLPTQMHERYIFPIFAFLPIVLVLNQKNMIYKIVFVLLSISILLNLHLVMLLNYPDTTNIPLLPSSYSEPLTNILAAINILLYLMFLATLIKNLNRKLAIFLTVTPFILLLFLAIFPKVSRTQKDFVYLSSLAPEKFSQGWGTLQTNKSVDGQRLSTSFYFYEKGLGTHANSEIVYNLDKKYKYLTTDLGIDTETHEPASVEFKILTDGNEVFKSGKMGKWDGPRSVKIDLANTQKLTLVVTDAGDGINNDHADWLNPKLFSP